MLTYAAIAADSYKENRPENTAHSEFSSVLLKFDNWYVSRQNHTSFPYTAQVLDCHVDSFT